jgi:transcriptional regulator with XRE-family HTH domain
VSKWENDLSYPDPTILTRLADTLGLSWASLLESIDDKSDELCLVKEDFTFIVYEMLDQLLGPTPTTDKEAQLMKKRHAHLMPILFMLTAASTEHGRFAYSLTITRAEAQDWQACSKLLNFGISEFWDRYIIIHHNEKEIPEYAWTQIDALTIIEKCARHVMSGRYADTIEYTSEPYADNMMPDAWLMQPYYQPTLIAEIGLQQHPRAMIPIGV